MVYLIHGSYLAHIFNKSVLADFSECHPNLVECVRIYREVTVIYRMFPYLSFIVNLFFNVVDHPVGRSIMSSDVAHSTPTNSYRFELRRSFKRSQIIISPFFCSKSSYS